jgi:hypothetical protein
MDLLLFSSLIDKQLFSCALLVFRLAQLKIRILLLGAAVLPAETKSYGFRLVVSADRVQKLSSAMDASWISANSTDSDSPASSSVIAATDASNEMNLPEKSPANQNKADGRKTVEYQFKLPGHSAADREQSQMWISRLVSGSVGGICYV